MTSKSHFLKTATTLLMVGLNLLLLAQDLEFNVVDTDFSKGRIGQEQTIGLNDLVRFHGHLCDGLVVGAQAMQQALNVLYPNQPIDRTNLRLVSQPSPCITDVGAYLSGGRYQFNTFYVDQDIPGLYVIQRIDNKKAVSVSLNQGVKPERIDQLGKLAVQGKLTPCEIDELRALEDAFTEFLLNAKADEMYMVTELDHFEWQPILRNDFVKTDVINKHLPCCSK